MGVTVWRLKDAKAVASNEHKSQQQAIVMPERANEKLVTETHADISTQAVKQSLAQSTDDLASRQVHIARLDWQALQTEVASCQACQLARTRNNTVFGAGNKAADLLIVGEAPGAEEDRQGLPFVGRAGQLLTEMLLAIGLQREQVFIANTLKCRPPNNRDPVFDEVSKCQPFLSRQVALIQPKVILALGRIAAQNLLNSDLSLGRLRGRAHNYMATGIPVYVSYHPAYLLRSPQEKAKAWQDLQVVASLL